MQARELTLEVQDELGDNQVRCLALGSTDGLVRGAAVRSLGGPITVPVGEGTLGRLFNVLGETIDSNEPVKAAAFWPIHRPPPALKYQEPTARIFETGIKVVDLMAAVHSWRKGRTLRRRRRRQDGAHSRAHPQHRLRPQRLLGLHRRGRAYARRQRPLDRNERVGRARANDARVRTDGRAAGRAFPRRADGRHDGGIFPRRARRRRVALHRQHLPLHAGRFGSLGADGPHAVGRRLSADARHRHGRARRAHHVDAQRFDHFGAGRLRAGRRLHRSGASRRPSRISMRRPRFRGRSRSSASIRPSIPLASTSRILDPQIIGQEHYEVARGVQEVLQRYRDLQDIIAIWVSKSSRRTIRSRWRERAAFSASSRSRSSSPNSSPDARASTSSSRRPSRRSRKFSRVKSTILPEAAFFYAGTIDEVRANAERMARA